MIKTARQSLVGLRNDSDASSGKIMNYLNIKTNKEAF